MKNKLLLILLLFSFNDATPVYANAFLERQEIIKLLSGNSISGQWNGRAFKQNIHRNGIADVYFNNTRYKIPWKVTSKHQYCENWGELGWYCSKLKNKINNTISVIRYQHDIKIESIWRWYPGEINLTRITD